MTPAPRQSVAEDCPSCHTRPAFGSMHLLERALREAHAIPGVFHVWVVCGCGGRPWAPHPRDLPNPRNWPKIEGRQAPRYRDLSRAWNLMLNTSA